MNERIEAIAKEAGIHLDYFGLGSCLDGGNPDIGLFAELIIQECMNVAVNKDAGISYTADVAGYVAAGRSNAARAIKQHFEGI